MRHPFTKAASRGILLAAALQAGAGARPHNALFIGYPYAIFA